MCGVSRRRHSANRIAADSTPLSPILCARHSAISARVAPSSRMQDAIGTLVGGPDRGPPAARRDAAGEPLDRDRIAGKTWIQRGVGHNQQFARPAENVGAKRHGPRGFGQRQAVVGLEPLSIAVEQRHQRDGRAANLRGQCRQIVECRLRRRIQHSVILQRAQAFRLPQRIRGRRHGVTRRRAAAVGFDRRDRRCRRRCTDRQARAVPTQATRALYSWGLTTGCVAPTTRPRGDRGRRRSPTIGRDSPGLPRR